MIRLFSNKKNRPAVPARECDWCPTSPCDPTCGEQTNPTPGLAEQRAEFQARMDRYNNWGVTR